MATTESQSLLTAEQFAAIPDAGRPTELVRGRVIEMAPPGSRHGQICLMVARIVGNYVADRNLGHVVCNDTGVVTERDPDSVRGADVAFYSFARVPPGRLPAGYLDTFPDVVFEVRSPSDRRSEVDEKTAEYLNAGVKAVCALDPDTDTIDVNRAARPLQRIGASEDLVLPEIDEAFRVPVRRFVE